MNKQFIIKKLTKFGLIGFYIFLVGVFYFGIKSVIMFNNKEKAFLESYGQQEKISSEATFKLSKTSLFLYVNEEDKVDAKVLDNEKNPVIKWYSENNKVATVNSNGKIKAVGEGETNIIVKRDNGDESKVKIVIVNKEKTKNKAKKEDYKKVQEEEKKASEEKNKPKAQDAKSISLNKNKIGITVGDSYKLKVTFNPKNVKDKNINWLSNNTDVATVNSNGKVKAISEGTAVIIASTTNGKTAMCEVTVAKKVIKVTAIELTPSSISMYPGDTKFINATIKPSTSTDQNIDWSSSNTSIATVTSDGKVTAISPGSVIITAVTSNGKKSTCKVTVKILQVSKIELNNTNLTMYPNESKQLIATVLPSNAVDKKVTWTSSDTKVVTVDANGNIKSVAVGNAKITAKTSNGVTAVCNVVVAKKIIEVSSIKLSSTSLSINPNVEKTLTATISPSDATNKTVTWTSSNTKVATVTSAGKVKSIAPGKATITAKTSDGKTATCTVTVNEIKVKTVTLNYTSKSLNPDGSVQLKVTISPTDATNTKITWSSSNSSIATVSSSGKVTAVVPGKATITAKSSNGITATCAITVNEVKATSISLNKTSGSIYPNESGTLKATISPSNTTNKTVTWTSSNTAIATVSSSGKVTAVASGSATITAKTSNGKTASYSLTVKKRNDTTIHFISMDEYTGPVTEDNFHTGDAILFHTGTHYGMIDMGNMYKLSNVINYLQKYKVKKLDFVLFSHMDYDHCGNIRKILEHEFTDGSTKYKIKIGTVYMKNYNYDSFKQGYTPKKDANGVDEGGGAQSGDNKARNVIYSKYTRVKYFLNKYKSQVGEIVYLSKSDEEKTISFKDFGMQMTLYNTSQNPNIAASGDNFNSIVSLVRVNGYKLLFTGDATDTKQFNTITSKIRSTYGKMTILKSPHHGSRSCALLTKKYKGDLIDSSGTNVTSTAMDSISPKYVVITSSKKKLESIKTVYNASGKTCQDKILDYQKTNTSMKIYYADEATNALVVTLGDTITFKNK